jgi:hypothetical protein
MEVIEALRTSILEPRGYDGLRRPHLDGLNRPHHGLPDASVGLIWIWPVFRDGNEPPQGRSTAILTHPDRYWT